MATPRDAIEKRKKSSVKCHFFLEAYLMDGSLQTSFEVTIRVTGPSLVSETAIMA